MIEWVYDWRFWAALITLLTSWTGFLVGIIKWLISRMIREIHRKIETGNQNCEAKWMQIEASVKQTDNDLKTLMIQLPMHYQRREDAIREYTTINSKLDRLHELIVKGKDK